MFGALKTNTLPQCVNVYGFMIMSFFVFKANCTVPWFAAVYGKHIIAL